MSQGKFSRNERRADKKNNVRAFYYQILESILTMSKNSKNEDAFFDSLHNENLYIGLYICSLETYNFIHNLNCLSFDSMMYHTNQEVIPMWRVVYQYARIEKSSVPISIVKHFGEIEIHLVSYLAWREENSFNSFCNSIAEFSEKENESPLTGSKTLNNISLKIKIEELFYRKILATAATQVFHLGNVLEIPESDLEDIWMCVKFIFTEKQILLVGRHLDLIIFCSIYLVCKMIGIKKMFNDIFHWYLKTS